ncbi:MAG: hypothetical protein ACPGNV_05065 [Mangrovicoccus sp.]
MRRVLIFVMAMLVMSPMVSAGEYRIPGLRPNDSFLTQDGIKTRLVGRRVTYKDKSASVYYKNGSYEYYAHEDAEPKPGRYKLYDHGMICVTFKKGGARCDTYVRSVKKLVLITAGGTRYPVRSAIKIR